jgi:uncharacterized protein YoxC
MSVGDVAGLVAAFAFVLLVGFLAVPLVKLGRALDETSRSIRELTEHSVPILDEAATTVASTNDQLVKVASFSYGVRQGFARAWRKQSDAGDAR